MKRCNEKQTAVNNESREDMRPAKERSVMVYVIALIATVLLLILLSYFVQNRTRNAELDALSQQHTSSLQKIEDLQNTNVMLEDENENLKKELKSAGDRISELEDELEKTKEKYAEDIKKLEEGYKAEYDELLQKYNELNELQDELQD